MPEYHITALMPIWGRPKILAAIIPKIPKWVTSAVFVTSPEDPCAKDINPASFGFHGDFVTISKPNHPLGAKMNEGYWAATQFFPFDYILNIGSDDILHPDLLPFYLDHFKGELPDGLFGIDSVDFYDTITGGAIRCWYNESPIVMGAGRMISRQWIDKLDGDINLHAQRRGLDTNSQVRLTSFGCPTYKLRAEGMALDIKSDGNLNSFASMMRQDVIDSSPLRLDYLQTRYGFDRNSV